MTQSAALAPTPAKALATVVTTVLPFRGDVTADGVVTNLAAVLRLAA